MADICHSLSVRLCLSPNIDPEENEMVRVISYYLLLLMVLTFYGGQV